MFFKKMINQSQGGAGKGQGKGSVGGARLPDRPLTSLCCPQYRLAPIPRVRYSLVPASSSSASCSSTPCCCPGHPAHQGQGEGGLGTRRSQPGRRGWLWVTLVTLDLRAAETSLGAVVPIPGAANVQFLIKKKNYYLF